MISIGQLLAPLLPFQRELKFSVRLPCGSLRKFAHAETFQAYVRSWPEGDFYKVWPLPFVCLITTRKAPF